MGADATNLSPPKSPDSNLLSITFADAPINQTNRPSAMSAMPTPLSSMVKQMSEPAHSSDTDKACLSGLATLVKASRADLEERRHLHGWIYIITL